MVHRAGVDLREGRVDRREHGELAAVQGVDQVDLRVDLAGDRRDQGGQQRVVGRGGGDRVLGHAVDRAGAGRAPAAA